MQYIKQNHKECVSSISMTFNKAMDTLKMNDKAKAKITKKKKEYKFVF